MGVGNAAGSVAVVFGTRPEIIKLAPILELLGDRARVVYTGQHFDDAMSRTFFDQMEIRLPDVELGVGGMSRASQIGEGVRRLEQAMTERRPDLVAVQGDTNSTLAGALTANALEVPLVHVEAGLRSFDRAMPEEHNRVLTDHLADLLLAPTSIAVENLRAERIGETIVNTGNTVVEAARRLLPPSSARTALLARHRLTPGGYHLATFHRPENVDDAEVMARILTALGGLDAPVVLPVHPRTAQRIRTAGLESLLDGLVAIEPAGYAEFLGLAAECRCLITDSGGVQEEASVLRKPVVVLRNSTERPEILGVFGDLIRDPGAIADTVEQLTSAERLGVIASASCPYGDGDAARRSLEAIDELIGT